LMDKKFKELCKRLKKLIKDEDKLRFYPLSSHTLGQVIIWGEPPLTTFPSSTVV